MSFSPIARVLSRLCFRRLAGYWVLLSGVASLAIGCQTTPTERVDAHQAERVNRASLVARVPFELAGNHLFAPVRLNGFGPYSFVLDTGASRSTINQKLADELKLKRWPIKAKAEALGGWAQIQCLRGVRLNIGGVAHAPGPAFSIPLPDFGERPIDGILGGDVFRRFVVELDFSACELRLHNPRTYRPEPGDVALPLRFHHRLPLVQARVGGAAGKASEGQFLIDSGYSGWLMLSESFARSNRLFEVAGPLQPERGADAVGALERVRGRVPAFRLGPYQLNQPIAHFEKHPLLNPDGLAGTIGTGLLRRFHVVFDYPRRRLWLRPNAEFAQPFEWRWSGSVMRVNVDGFCLRVSGVDLTAPPPAFDRFVITKVKPGSPAEQAGLRLGDTVLSLNGEPLGAMPLERWFELSSKSPSIGRMEVRRDGEKRVVSLRIEWDCYQETPIQYHESVAK
jgi:hypothetical protein